MTTLFHRKQKSGGDEKPPPLLLLGKGYAYNMDRGGCVACVGRVLDVV